MLPCEHPAIRLGSLLICRIAAGDMTPRQDPCQESSSVPALGTAVKGELLRHRVHDTGLRSKVNGRHRSSLRPPLAPSGFSAAALAIFNEIRQIAQCFATNPFLD